MYKKEVVRIKRIGEWFFCLVLLGLQFVLTDSKCLAQKNEFILGAYYSPTISYRNIKSTNSVWDFMTDNLDSIEKPNNNNNFGLNCEFKLSKKLNIGFGVGITKLSEKCPHKYIRSFNPIIIETENLYNTYKYLKIPIFVNYRFIEIKDFSIGINAGLSTDFLIDFKRSEFSYRKYVSLSEWKYNNIALSILAGLEFEYKIKKFVVYTNSFYCHYITANAKYDFADKTGLLNNANVSIKQLNYYYGLEFGFRYIIKTRNKTAKK